MKRLVFLFKEALANIRTNRTVTIISVVTTAFTLACFGVFLLLYLNIKTLFGVLQEDIQVIVYLQDNVNPKQIQSLRDYLKEDPAVKSLSYISKDKALTEFRRQFPDESALLEGMGTNPLPGSLVATLAQEHRSADAVEDLSARISGQTGVDQIRYSRDWIEMLRVWVGYFEWAALGIGTILSVASMTIIANTVRLTFYARKEEVEILRLIGATGMFIAFPYLVEGALLGALGGCLSVLLLKGGLEMVLFQVGGSELLRGMETVLHVFPIHLSALLILIGVVLGCASSLVSLLGLMKVRI